MSSTSYGLAVTGSGVPLLSPAESNFESTRNCSHERGADWQVRLPLKFRDGPPLWSAGPRADFGFEPRRFSDLSRSLSVLWACEMSLF